MSAICRTCGAGPITVETAGGTRVRLAIVRGTCVECYAEDGPDSTTVTMASYEWSTVIEVLRDAGWTVLSQQISEQVP